RRGQGGVGKSQALPDLHRGRFVADACDQQLHCVSVSRRPLCAAQVMAEQPKAVIARMAAFLPRHPAVTRRNTIAKQMPQVTKEMLIRGSEIQPVPSSMKAQVLPA